jgi:hypothetical protein
MPQNELKWRVLPARNKTKLAIFLSVVIVFLGIVLITSGALWTLFAAAILAISLSSFYTPTTYRLDDERVIIRKPLYMVTREWEEIRRVTIDKNGIFLSPFKKRTRMENFRGVFLIVREDKDEIVNFIRERVGEEVPMIDARRGKPKSEEQEA